MGDTCIICYDPVPKRTPDLECGHKIHPICFQKWRFSCKRYKTSTTCPYCRHPINNMRITRSETNVKHHVHILRDMIANYHDLSIEKQVKKLIDFFHYIRNHRALFYHTSLCNAFLSKIDQLIIDVDQYHENIDPTIASSLIHEMTTCQKLIQLYTSQTLS